MRQSLVLLVDDLPLFLESGDELLFLGVVHEELLPIHVGLFLDLHLPHELVLVLDLLLDGLEILGHPTLILLLQVVLAVVLGQLGCGEDVLDCVRNNEVLVGHQAHDRLLVLFGDRWFLLFAAIELVNYNLRAKIELAVENENGFEILDDLLTLWQDHGSSSLESELSWVWLGGPLWDSESCAVSFLLMASARSLHGSDDVRNIRLRSGDQAEGARRWCRQRVVFGSVALRLWRHVSLLGDQVEDALFVFHFITSSFSYLNYKVQI